MTPQIKTPTLHPHQKAWLRDVNEAFRKHSSVLAESPTGSGKTVVLAKIAEVLTRADKRVVMLVHRQEIFLQTSERLVDFGLSHDLICSNEVASMASINAARRGVLMPRYGNKVILASLPTLMRRGKIPKVDWVFVDEAHHSAAKTWAEVIRVYAAGGAKVLGVTATPERNDGEPLSDLFEVLVPGPPMRELIANGFLSPFSIKVPAQQIDIDGVRVKGGEYRMDDLAPRARVIVGDAIEQYRRHLDGERCIVFVPGVEEAQRAADDFCKAGYRAVAVDGKMPEVERNDRISGLAEHRYQVLVNDSVLSEGLDVPSVSGMISLRPTFSRGRWMQEVGRALRFEPGKEVVVLDHSNNTAFHGNPMDITDFRFHGNPNRRKKKSVERVVNAVVNCPRCFVPYRAALDKCPDCGHVREKRVVKYDKRDGDLVEHGGALDEGVLAAKAVAAALRDDAEIDERLADIARAHNMPQSWIDTMKERIDWYQTPIGAVQLDGDRQAG